MLVKRIASFIAIPLLFLFFFPISATPYILATEYTVEEGGPACGNGLIDVGEGCDDNNTNEGDGCNSSCQVEQGWSCAGEPSTCNTVCGDGIIKGGEQCDDNNTNSGDGCDSVCTIESGWTCSGSPSVCSQAEEGVPGGPGAPMDTRPPVISRIEVSVSSNSATITWLTSEPSISWVLYGKSIIYGQEIKTTEYLSSHSLTLPDLLAETIYHYQVKSKDQKGNIGSFTDRTFTTLSSDLIEQLKKRIAEILTEIARLRALMAQLQGGEGIPAGFKFTKDLRYKDNLQDVQYLQIFLNSDPETQLKASPGQYGFSANETIHFGPLTLDAVIRFQEKYSQEILAPLGLTKGTGFVGSATRAKLNELLGK